MTSKNRNDFSKFTQPNASLSWSNATILGKMAALRKIMVTLTQHVSIMATTNNNSGGSVGKQKNTSVAYHFNQHTIGHTDGANKS